MLFGSKMASCAGSTINTSGSEKIGPAIIAIASGCCMAGTATKTIRQLNLVKQMDLFKLTELVGWSAIFEAAGSMIWKASI